MAITVSMIEDKEFTVVARGFDRTEVDEFLDEICDEMCAMQDEMYALRARNAQLLSMQAQQSAGQLPTPPAPAPVQQAPVANAADTLSHDSAQKLLQSAQRTYDLTLADARQEADRIVNEAKEQARQITAEAQNTASLSAEKQALEMELKNLRAAAKAYREQFIDLVKSQKELLDDADVLFD